MGERLTNPDLAQLSVLAARSIRGILRNWDALKQELQSAGGRPKAHALGWMQTRDYLTLAARSLEQKVLAPLSRFGIDPRPYLDGKLEALAPSAGTMPNAEAAA